MIDILRSQTHSQHIALHDYPLLAGLSRNQISDAEFNDILLAFDAYYSAAEAARFPVGHDLPDAPVRQWLSKDLMHRGLNGLQGRIVFRHPPIDTLSKLVGYLYTKQGSTLGGRVISKHLQACLGLVPGVDQRFFAGYGEDNGLQWKRFVAGVESLADRLDADEAAAAAQAAFEHIAWVCDQVAELRQTHAA